MDQNDDSTKPGEELLAKARTLLAVLRSQARRAFVLELTGTPKAGKSTSVVTLQTFFREAGYQVHLLRERAADCPLPMKGHFFFNAWTMATMLAEVLATQETSVDILILDRGFFDALVWLELQARRDQVTHEEKRVFSDFVLLERWRSLVDATVSMTVQPNKALSREHQNQIVPRNGSMMNPDSLAHFNDALDHVAREYGELFSLIRVDTTDATDVVTTNTDLLRQLLPRIEVWADPAIAVVPKSSVLEVFGDRPFLHSDDATDALVRLTGDVFFEKRSVAEKNPDVVQFIAAGIHAYKDRVVIFEREPRDKKASSYGRCTLWLGCHVDRDDGELLDYSSACLIRRIQQDLHLSSRPELEFLGLAWDKTQRETQHVGIMFRAPISSDLVAKHLENKQFKRMARSSKIRSVFMTQEEIVRGLDDIELEPWSEHMARNIKLTKDSTP